MDEDKLLAESLLNKAYNLDIPCLEQGWWIPFEDIPEHNSSEYLELINDIKESDYSIHGFGEYIEHDESKQRENWHSIYIEIVKAHNYYDGDILRYFIFNYKEDTSNVALGISKQIAFGRKDNIELTFKDFFKNKYDAINYLQNKGINIKD